MSLDRTELVTETKTPTVHVGSFHGGEHRGKCIQLTQSIGNETASGFQFVHLDKEQALQLIADLSRFVAGE